MFKDQDFDYSITSKMLCAGGKKGKILKLDIVKYFCI